MISYEEWKNNRELVELWNETWKLPHMQKALEVLASVNSAPAALLDHDKTNNLLESYALNYARVEGRHLMYAFLTQHMGQLLPEVVEDNRPFTEKSHGEVDLIDENDQETIQQILSQKK